MFRSFFLHTCIRSRFYSPLRHVELFYKVQRSKEQILQMLADFKQLYVKNQNNPCVLYNEIVHNQSQSLQFKIKRSDDRVHYENFYQFYQLFFVQFDIYVHNGKNPINSYYLLITMLKKSMFLFKFKFSYILILQNQRTTAKKTYGA